MAAVSPEILLHAGPDEVAEALAARLMARLTEIQRDFRIPQLARSASPPGPTRNSRTKVRIPPSTGHGSSSGGATNVSCRLIILIGTPSRPLTCSRHRWH